MAYSVGVIGGGVSGLACARHLLSSDPSLRVSVFDTGKHAVGGRCSTRTFDGIGGQRYVFDHSVQCFTATSLEFRKEVTKWLEDGTVRVWQSSKVGHLKDGKFKPLLDATQVFIGTKGACSIALKMSEGLSIMRPVWISKISRVGEKWHLYNYDTLVGQFSHIVIAHNGKCADRLTTDASIPRINGLLKARFGANIPDKFKVGGRMQLCSLWVVLVAFRNSLSLPYEGGFIEGSAVLSWIANNSKKLNSASMSQSHECWTLISTREFGESHKMPQENIPKKTQNDIASLLLTAFQEVTGLESLPPRVFTYAQLWGAAVPLNVLESSCVFQNSTNVGICGDWLLKPSIEGAYLSGIELAKSLLHSMKGVQNDLGLQCSLRKYDASSLGSFDFTARADEEILVASNKVIIRHQDCTSGDNLRGTLHDSVDCETGDIARLTQTLKELCIKRQTAVESKNKNAKNRINKKIREVVTSLKELNATGIEKYLDDDI